MGCANTKQIMETPTDDLVEKYAKAVGMDQANKKILMIALTQGWETAAETMMEESGNDYFTMRMKYG